MKTYQIEIPVKAKGSQIFEAEAETYEEALALVQDGYGSCVAEDLEVTDMIWTSARNVTSTGLDR